MDTVRRKRPSPFLKRSIPPFYFAFIWFRVQGSRFRRRLRRKSTYDDTRRPLFSPSFLWKEVPRRGGGWPRETVLPHSRKPTPPRFARLPLPEEGARMICKETRIKSFSFAVRDSRPHICCAVPLSSSVFHAACALSAPAEHLPLKGKAGDTRIASSHKAFGHHPVSSS